MGLFAVTIDAPTRRRWPASTPTCWAWRSTYEGPEGALIAGGGKSVMFQQVSDYTPPQWPDPAHPQQAHLDIIVDDLPLKAVEARALELGATRLADGATWITLADPAGHPFDLSIP